MTTEQYLADLTYELRLLDIPGVEIGNILTETESHLAEAGGTPEDIFGSPRSYAHELAKARGAQIGPERPSRGALLDLVRSMRPWDWGIAAVALGLSVLGAMFLWRGVGAVLAGLPTWTGLPAWAEIVIGVALLATWSLWARSLEDPIVRPEPADDDDDAVPR